MTGLATGKTAYVPSGRSLGSMPRAARYAKGDGAGGGGFANAARALWSAASAAYIAFSRASKASTTWWWAGSKECFKSSRVAPLAAFSGAGPAAGMSHFPSAPHAMSQA